MRLALWLASKALGDTSPNPAVGAVIVKSERVVGQGYHRQAGLPHAEVEALREAGARAKGATMFVTLEPCAHTGRTPPCCEAIIEAGIRCVVVARKDPNPLTNGRGIARLRSAGIQVILGVLEEEAERLNAPFAKFITKALPWAIVKISQSLDGKIATRTGDSKWISSVASRELAHRLRRQVDAIVVGVNTVRRDDPLLTVRGAGRPVRPHKPLKVIVDSHLRTPLTSRCLSKASPAKTILATTERSSRKRAPFLTRGADVLVLPSLRGRVPLARLFRELARRYGVMSVLIEGGGEVIASALEERLVDRVVWSIAPIIIGGRTSPSSVGGEGPARLAKAVRVDDVLIQRMGVDLVLDASIEYPN